MIQSHRFREMVVDGVTHHNDLLLLPAQTLPGWWRQSGHELCIDKHQNPPFTPR